ncbi:ring-cleaving dioxygenase [Criblamydia sequanensis]|uniref:VOC domain-containing protein n=1 Tax=Candidatus Criblamydia sequanensis CRIB-18 TaxID=1437425 RepID=A0A090D0I1_9BACT|nr:ring-cleaving dioxygenase [Criblamydia sequanensis]CDR34796.1 Conserved hypothetical protein [Criblamydia sequanensis CRIB-18]
MASLIQGLHHITALAKDPQKNLDFYAGILGLRLVKKTVNFDAPEIYHLYYGDEKGSPGTIMTFFPYPDIPKGRQGKGQLTTTSFSISEKSIDYWINRFEKWNVSFRKPVSRFEEIVLSFEDNEGLSLELVAGKEDKREGFTKGPLPKEHALKGFYGITLSLECIKKTAALLTEQLDYQLVREEKNRFRYASKINGSEQFVDLLLSPDSLRGLSGYGTVHHVAFATESNQTEQQVQSKLSNAGFNVTPVIDREYFHSIYFREPGGVLFEVATYPPGFTRDESLENLGSALKLPPWEEAHRKRIEKGLPELSFDKDRFLD